MRLSKRALTQQSQSQRTKKKVPYSSEGPVVNPICRRSEFFNYFYGAYSVDITFSTVSTIDRKKTVFTQVRNKQNSNYLLRVSLTIVRCKQGFAFGLVEGQKTNSGQKENKL